MYKINHMLALAQSKHLKAAYQGGKNIKARVFTFVLGNMSGSMPNVSTSLV